MKYFFSLFCLLVLQGCAVVGSETATVTVEHHRVSDAANDPARIVIKNGSNRDLYFGTIPVTVTLTRSVGPRTQSYTVKFGIFAPGNSREIVLHHDQTGWSMVGAGGGVERTIPYGVLLVSSDGSVSVIPVDELNAKSAWLNLKMPVGRGELVVMLTDGVPLGVTRSGLATCISQDVLC